MGFLAFSTSQNWANKAVEGEQCFGAIGVKCKGGGDAIEKFLAPPAQDSGSGMLRQWVSVGTILHDNCCRLTPDGQHCQYFNPSQGLWTDSRHCVKKWRKVFYNSRDNRKWQTIFGPYPDGFTEDDLTDAPARRASLFNRIGRMIGYYKGTETVSTRLLKAPSGTALDIDDVECCASGNFKFTRSGPFIGR